MLIIFPHTYGLKSGNIVVTQLEGVIRVHKDDDFLVKRPLKTHPAIGCLTPKGVMRSIRFEDRESRDRVFDSILEAFSKKEAHLYIPSSAFYTSIVSDEEAFSMLRQEHVPKDLYWQASIVSKRAPIQRLDAFKIFTDPAAVISDAIRCIELLKPNITLRKIDYVANVFMATLPIPKSIPEKVTPYQYFKYKCGNY